MAVLSNPEAIRDTWALSQVYSHLGFSSDAAFLFFLGVCSLVAIVASNACLGLNQWVTVHLSASIQERLEASLLDSYLHAPFEEHVRRSPAELKRNVLDETLTFSGIGKTGLQLLASCFVILCISTVLLLVNPVLSCLLGLVVGGSYAFVYLMIRRRTARIGELRMDANLQRHKMVDEGLGGLKELQILQRTGWIMNRYRKAANTLTTTLAKQSVLGTFPRYFIEVFGLGGMILVVLYLLAVQGDARAATPIISVFAFGAYRILPAMQQAYASTMALRFYAPVARHMQHELECARQRCNRTKQASRGDAPVSFQSRIELKDVSFKYSEDRSDALRGVSMVIDRGSFVGVVGETGSGKTTLANIVLGLLNPQTGRLLIDGKPLEGTMVGAWQRSIGYVPQDVYLADDTLKANIAFGLPSDEVDSEAVRDAARLAQLHDFVEGELPLGYETLVGDRGIRLSGGQRQRIGIARALYHQPEVLVLDEATSMLDGETEARVFSAVERLAGSRTLIVIAHRLATIRRADLVYLLEGGSLVDLGTYDELTARSSRFRNMALSRVGSPPTMRTTTKMALE
jgi:ATP-binding cassette subfamily C protein